MNLLLLANAIYEAERFIAKAKQAQMRQETERREKGDWTQVASKETAACRRASMDLTRALATLRRF